MSQYVSVESSSLNHYMPYSWFIVSCVDSLIGSETFMQAECFESLQKQRARVWIQKIQSNFPSNLLPTAVVVFPFS